MSIQEGDDGKEQKLRKVKEPHPWLPVGGRDRLRNDSVAWKLVFW
jgi:hypothetical protein